MNLTELQPEHVGRLVSLVQEDEDARVQLVGHLSSYELQWHSGHLVHAWLVVGGKEHMLSTPEEVTRTTCEVVAMPGPADLTRPTDEEQDEGDRDG